ncbi:hypothetical protein K7X08_032645 [Anisodus acutangulus]|uniref:Uncharacterized protein n=1 Tax=Anisodus acutangulus TaxID=402998 RepID=A0A9Q1RB28_9SOLA|nr:hypothetical protein K7X08_032645 [Anisodus acutangulus]
MASFGYIAVKRNYLSEPIGSQLLYSFQVLILVIFGRNIQYKVNSPLLDCKLQSEKSSPILLYKERGLGKGNGVIYASPPAASTNITKRKMPNEETESSVEEVMA